MWRFHNLFFLQLHDTKFKETTRVTFNCNDDHITTCIPISFRYSNKVVMVQNDLKLPDDSGKVPELNVVVGG